jgi:hypothetical protein
VDVFSYGVVLWEIQARSGPYPSTSSFQRPFYYNSFMCWYFILLR